MQEEFILGRYQSDFNYRLLITVNLPLSWDHRAALSDSNPYQGIDSVENFHEKKNCHPHSLSSVHSTHTFLGLTVWTEDL